ncbi:hypothetical protein AB3S75_036592 [Citrus x aurantiifolia]
MASNADRNWVNIAPVLRFIFGSVFFVSGAESAESIDIFQLTSLSPEMLLESS